ncbi:MAG: hypothetical protein RLZZ565_913, partial [Planctomycetota bacterium]
MSRSLQISVPVLAVLGPVAFASAQLNG